MLCLRGPGTGPCGPGHLTVMLQCAVQSQSDEKIARAQIRLRRGSPKAVPRPHMKPDLGARHDVVLGGPLSSASQWHAHSQQQCTRRTSAASRCELSRVHVAGGRGLDDRGERKLIMWLCAGLVAHDAVARATEAVSSRWRAGGGQVAGRGAVAHLQIKTSPRAVRSGAMRERGAVLMTAVGSVVQCASDTAGRWALPMAPAHLPVAVT